MTASAELRDRVAARETRRGRIGEVHRVDGEYLIGYVGTDRTAILVHDGQVNTDVLTAMYAEVDAHGLGRPLRVWGRTCTRGDNHRGCTFKFRQLVEL